MFHTFSKNLKYSCVQLQQIRFRKVDLKRLQPPHYVAQRALKATEMKIPKPYDVDFPPHLKCRKPLKWLITDDIPEYPYQRILANEIKEAIFKSSMILVVHQNPTSVDDFQNSQRKFFKEGIEVIQTGKSTLEMALENSKYLNLRELFTGNTLLLCSKEMKLDVTFKLLKKMPYYVLLAGIVEDRFLHKKKLEEYSKLPNLQIMRAQLSNTLLAVATQFSELVVQPQITTVAQLNQYKEMQSKQAVDSEITQDKKGS